MRLVVSSCFSWADAEERPRIAAAQLNSAAFMVAASRTVHLLYVTSGATYNTCELLYVRPGATYNTWGLARRAEAGGEGWGAVSRVLAPSFDGVAVIYLGAGSLPTLV